MRFSATSFGGGGGVDEDARDWANRILRDGLPPPAWFFESVAGAPGVGLDHLAYLYISGFRPLPVGASRQLPEGTIVQVNDKGTRGVIRAPAPLDPAFVARFELLPMRPASIGSFLWATLSDGRKLELSKDYGEQAVLIFKNPRRIWQASHFQIGLGPTGHTESASPEVLTWEAFAAGYRAANTGAVDSIMEGLG